MNRQSKGYGGETAVPIGDPSAGQIEPARGGRC